MVSSETHRLFDVGMQMRLFIVVSESSGCVGVSGRQRRKVSLVLRWIQAVVNPGSGSAGESSWCSSSSCSLLVAQEEVALAAVGWVVSFAVDTVCVAFTSDSFAFAWLMFVGAFDAADLTSTVAS